MAPDDPALGLRRSATVVRETTRGGRTSSVARNCSFGDRWAISRPVVEHLGSTAVPGLAAKPVLDIAVALVDLSTCAEVRGRLESCGCAYRATSRARAVRCSRRGRSRDARAITFCEM